MASKLIRRGHCTYGDDCPEVRVEEGGDVRITGYKPGAEQTAENELTIVVPPSVLPEVADLDIPDFAAFRRSVRKTPGDIYRVQTLTHYRVTSDVDYFERYLSGKDGPTVTELKSWGEQLDADYAAGRVYRNLHVIDGDLTEYLRYQFEWGYSYNSAHGQDIRILDVTQYPAASELLRIGDFWVLEHEHVVLCRYSEEGRPLGTVGAEAGGANGYIAAAEMAWQLGTPFAAWWGSHPEYHRETARGAS